MADNIKVYRELIDNGFLGPVMRYFYLTKVPGKDEPYDWKADLEDEMAECWNGHDTFKWEDEPCGQGIKPEDIPRILENATEIGYIDADTKELFITETWRVPTAYGHMDGKTIVIDSDLVGANGDF